MLHEPGQVDDHLRERGQIRAKALEQGLELRNDEYQQDGADDDGDGQHGDGIKQRFLDLFLQRFGFLLVSGDLVQQCFQRTGLFAGLDQIHEQIVEVQGVLRQRFMQGAAAFDVRLDVEHQLLHRRLFMAIADDFEGLHHGNAGRHHGRELAAEHGDIHGVDLAAGSKRLALGLDTCGGDALTAQVGTQRCFVRSKRLAAHLVAALILALPQELGFFLARGCRYRHKIPPLPLSANRW